jgi:hypothetical protein
LNTTLEPAYAIALFAAAVENESLSWMTAILSEGWFNLIQSTAPFRYVEAGLRTMTRFRYPGAVVQMVSDDPPWESMTRFSWSARGAAAEVRALLYGAKRAFAPSFVMIRV